MMSMSTADDESSTAGCRTVLVVEDDPIVLTLSTTRLGRAGYTVLRADGSVEAQAVCEGYPGQLDLILLDLVLYQPPLQLYGSINTWPRVHAETLLPMLRAKRPLSRILTMSASSAGESEGRGMGWIVRRYPFLKKPFTEDTLHVTVQDVLAKPVPACKPSSGQWPHDEGLPYRSFHGS